MEEQKREVSFLVFAGFLVLFVLFLFLSPDEKSSGSVVIGSVSLGENPSMITLLILFVILVVVLAAVFVIFKKLKKKKINIESPKPSDVKQSFEDKKEDKIDLGDEDIDKLFSGNGEKKKEENYNKDEEKAQSTEKKVLTNLQDLKNKIKGMLSQNLTREQVISNLKSHGVTMDQISRAIEDINIDSLRDYVTEALNQRFTKDQIVKNLAMRGWKQEQISKVI